MITPSVGRVVWFRAPGLVQDAQPQAAIVAYVHDDRTVNLMVIGGTGIPQPLQCVTLVQDGDAIEPGTCYCEWMPYQKGQAAKHEALEAKVGAPT